MSDYEIKIHEKGVEEAQAEIGNEVTKDWIDFGQTTAEHLRETYSRPDFDPETRLYAYKDGKMVGYFVSRVLPDSEDGIKRAQHDYPFVLKGHERAGELLYKKGIETLKKKGVKIVDARTFEGWPGSLEKAEKYGYKKADLWFIKISKSIDEITMDVKDNRYVEADPENDTELLIQYYMSQFNMTRDLAEANFAGIINPPEGKASQPIIKDGSKIISRGLVYVPKDPKIANFRFPTPDTKFMDSYLAYAAKFAKENGAEIFELYLDGPNMRENQKLLESKGFETLFELYKYEKEI